MSTISLAGCFWEFHDFIEVLWEKLVYACAQTTMQNLEASLQIVASMICLFYMMSIAHVSSLCNLQCGLNNIEQESQPKSELLR